MSISGGALVLHDTGTLVRYQRGDVSASDAVVTEGPSSIAAVTNEGATCFTAGTDGTIAELDPETLSGELIATVDATPLFMQPIAPFSLAVVTASGVAIVQRDTRSVPSIRVDTSDVISIAVHRDSVWLVAPDRLRCVEIIAGNVRTVATPLERLGGIRIRSNYGGYDAHGFRIPLPPTVWAYGSGIADVSTEPRMLWRAPVRSLTPNGRGFNAIVEDTYVSADESLAHWTEMAKFPPEVVDDAAAGQFVSSGGKRMFATAHGLYVLSGPSPEKLKIVPLASIRTYW